MQARVITRSRSPVISKRRVERRRWWQRRSFQPSKTFSFLQILDLRPSLWCLASSSLFGQCRPFRQGVSVWISSSLVLQRLVHSSQPWILVFQTCDIPLLLNQRHCEIRWTVKRRLLMPVQPGLVSSLSRCSIDCFLSREVGPVTGSSHRPTMCQC